MMNVTNRKAPVWTSAPKQPITEPPPDQPARASSPDRATATETLMEELLEEPAATLELSYEALKSPWDSKAAEEMRPQNTTAKNSDGLTDESRRLTRMLVAARSRLEVQSVISEAYKNMIGWHMAAASGDEKAAAVIRRLNKLIARGNRKVRDLNKEDTMLQRQKRAERAKQEHLERRLREELKRVERVRKQRERKYLHDPDHQDDRKQAVPVPSIAALEAKITALAQAMANLSTTTPGVESEVWSVECEEGRVESEVWSVECEEWS